MASTLLLCLGLAPYFAQASPDPLQPELRIALPADSFVGMPIPLEIVVSDVSPTELTVDWPVLDWAQLLPSGPGTAVLVPTRPGSALLPSIRVAAAGREGRTRPRRISFLSLPAAGRSASFLGGVGPLRIETDLDINTATVGQPITYQIRLRGPGAIATVMPAGGQGWLPPEREAERLDVVDTTVAEPPGRVIRYRLRPLRPGKLRFPALTVSTFRPETGRFETTRSRVREVDVLPPPPFDPAQVVEPSKGPGSGGMLIPLVAIGAMGIISSAVILLVAHRVRHSMRQQSSNGATALVAARAWLAATPESAELPLGIVRHVGAILREAAPTSPRWPTPDEAASSLEDPALADETRQLIEACEMAAFSRHSDGVPLDLRAAFGAWLERIESIRPRPRGD